MQDFPVLQYTCLEVHLSYSTPVNYLLILKDFENFETRSLVREVFGSSCNGRLLPVFLAISSHV